MIAMSDSIKTETIILISDGDQIVQQTTWIFRQLKQKDDGLGPPTEWAKPLDIKAFCHFHMFTKFKISWKINSISLILVIYWNISQNNFYDYEV